MGPADWTGQTVRFCILYLVFAAAALAQQVTGARFAVADLRQARDFYTRVFGFPEQTATGAGVAVFRVNQRQYLEFITARKQDPLETVYLGVTGALPAPLRDPDGHRVEFVHGQSGNSSPDSLSQHLLHVGMGVADLARSTDFYRSQFDGREIFRRPDNQIVILRMPGPHEDWLEFLVRQEQGSQDHICLDVPDIQKTYQALLARGAIMRGKPRVASNGHWVINMADPNGLRIELMEPQAASK